MESPRVTVLMPGYNGEKYLNDSIESILKQTYTDFELLIIDDASEDNSKKIINSYNDNRIKLISNNVNLGLIKSLNNGLKLARGEYIARMDTDDISHPERLERQVKYLDEHPDIGICGTWVQTTGILKHTWRFPIEHDEIRATLFIKNSIAHPSVMMRKDLLIKNHLYYDEHYRHVEDYELWVRSSRLIHLSNIGEVLLNYRLHKGQVGKIYCNEQRSLEISCLQLDNLGLKLDSQMQRIFQSIILMKFYVERQFIINAEMLLTKIKEANENSKMYPEPYFSMTIAQRWYEICRASTELGIWVWDHYWQSPLSQNICINKRNEYIFFILSRLKINRNRLKPLHKKFESMLYYSI
jgi:glycosyltransferase involved in cell wall biosynthesis